MSYRPTIGGRLRKETSGVDRSQAGCCLVGLRPRKGDWSDLWIERHHEAPSDLE